LQHYLWVALALLPFALAVGFLLKFRAWKEWAAVIGVPATFLAVVQKQKTEELKLFKDLFTEFNERYHVINGKIHDIPKTSIDVPFSRAERDLLFKYFNLCGEEYLFYEQGYIYPTVWDAWYNGMKIFRRENPRIREFWDEELRTNSYYELGFDNTEQNRDQHSTAKDDQKSDDGADDLHRAA